MKKYRINPYVTPEEWATMAEAWKKWKREMPKGKSLMWYQFSYPDPPMKPYAVMKLRAQHAREEERERFLTNLFEEAGLPSPIEVSMEELKATLALACQEVPNEPPA